MNVEQFIQFENYKAGKLSGQALLEFESRLVSDEQFKASYLEFEGYDEHLKDRLSIESAKKNLLAVHQEFEASKAAQSRKKRNSTAVIIALVCIALVFLISYFYFSKKEDTSSSLIASYYQVPTINLDTRSQTNASNNVFEGVAYYVQGDYEKALPLLDTTGFQQSFQFQILMARAASLHELGQRNESIQAWKELKAFNPSLEPTADWYLALLYLEADNIPETKAYFEKIPETSSYYKRARKILIYLK